MTPPTTSARARRPRAGSATTPTTEAATCWYRDPAHRPPLGWCPATCHGLVAFAERVGGGEQHTYCEAHGDWRRRTTHLPTVVRRLPAAV